MHAYRAYLLDQGGHVIKAVELVCEGDAAASQAARQLVDGHDVELWDRARKIAIFKHKPETRDLQST